MFTLCTKLYKVRLSKFLCCLARFIPGKFVDCRVEVHRLVITNRLLRSSGELLVVIFLRNLVRGISRLYHCLLSLSFELRVLKVFLNFLSCSIRFTGRGPNKSLTGTGPNKPLKLKP